MEQAWIDSGVVRWYSSFLEASSSSISLLIWVSTQVSAPIFLLSLHDSFFLFSSLTCWCFTENPLITSPLWLQSRIFVLLTPKLICIAGPDLTLEPTYPLYLRCLNFSLVALPLFTIANNTSIIHMVNQIRNREINLDSLFPLPREWDF